MQAHVEKNSITRSLYMFEYKISLTHAVTVNKIYQQDLYAIQFFVQHDVTQ